MALKGLIRWMGAAFTACVLATSACALDLDKMTAEEREIFRSEVRAYLLDNPEVIMEAVRILEERQQAQAAMADIEMVRANLGNLQNDAASWQGGNLDGDVTMVEFLDYRCGFCRRAHNELTELVESDGNIRLIVKEFPVLGEDSVLSSRFAIAVLQVAGPDAYKAAHDALITLTSNVSPRVLERLATQLDLDPTLVMAQMNSPEVTAVIARNRELAQQLNINGTPTFVVGDQMLRGFAPLAEMRQIVEAVRDAQG